MRHQVRHDLRRLLGDGSLHDSAVRSVLSPAGLALCVVGGLAVDVLTDQPGSTTAALIPNRRRASRSLVGLLPARYAQLALRLREVLDPKPDRHLAAVELYRAERQGSGILPYPQYLYGLLSATRTAMAVGSNSFTAIEFGVAGGNGLRALERHAEYVERRFPVTISVFGFDSGVGLLPASDPRDCAFGLPPGAFPMDEGKLRASLTRAELVLGPVEETIEPFMADAGARGLPPIGFVSIDLDVFTGTLAALRGIASDEDHLLPRVAMYFDDLNGYPYTTEDGEWAAIKVFNETSDAKIGQVRLNNQLGGTARMSSWPQQFFMLNVFDHPDYDAPEAREGALDTSLRV